MTVEEQNEVFLIALVRVVECLEKKHIDEVKFLPDVLNPYAFIAGEIESIVVGALVEGGK